MRDIEHQLQDYWSEMTSDLPEPSLEESRQTRLGDGAVRLFQERRPARRRPAWAIAVVAFAGVLLLGGAIWLLGLRWLPESDAPVATLPDPATPTTAGLAEPEMVTDQAAAGGLYWGEPGRLVAVSSEEVWASGRLSVMWPAARGDGIGHLVNGTWEYYRPVTGDEEPAPAGEVGGLAVAPDGTVWAATSLGVFSFDGEEWALQYEEPTPAVAVADDGTVWIGWGGDHSDHPAAVRAWLARWDGASFERVGPNPEAPPGGHSVPDGGYRGPSTAMAALPGNQVWVTGHGWTPVTMHYDGTSGEEELDIGMSAFAVAPNGDLWAIQYGGGWTGWLGRFDGSDWTYFEADPYLLRAESSLAVGPDGLVWVTSWASLYSFDGTNWTLHLERQHPYLVRLVDVAPDGTVWYVDKEGVHVFSP
jgi:hypothetical protein